MFPEPGREKFNMVRYAKKLYVSGEARRTEFWWRRTTALKKLNSQALNVFPLKLIFHTGL